MKLLSVENQSTQSPLTRKRPRPSASFHVHSPYLIANSANHKKRRLLRHATIADPSRYATRTASFRRALSLRSQAPDIQEKPHLTVIPTPASLNAETSSLYSTLDLEPSPGWIPTVPCSPEPEQPAHTTALRRAQNYRDPLFDPDVISPIAKDAQKAYDLSKKQARILSSKVPIIAPPPNHVYSPPLSEESQAKLRLIRFREREQRMRDTDFDMLHKTADVLTPSTSLTLAAEMMSETVVVDGGHSEDVEMHLEELDDETDQLQAEGFQVSRRTSCKRCAGIHGSGTRMIQWILEVCLDRARPLPVFMIISRLYLLLLPQAQKITRTHRPLPVLEQARRVPVTLLILLIQLHTAKGFLISVNSCSILLRLDSTQLIFS